MKKPLKALVRRVHKVEHSIIIGGRGRLGKTIGEIIKKKLDLNSLSKDMVYERTQCHNDVI